MTWSILGSMVTHTKKQKELRGPTFDSRTKIIIYVKERNKWLDLDLMT